MQRLVVSVTVETDLPGADSLNDAFDYAGIPALIDEVAASHIALIEIFAARVARACLDDPRNRSAAVRVEKPPALVNGMAWTTVTLSRDRNKSGI